MTDNRTDRLAQIEAKAVKAARIAAAFERVNHARDGARRMLLSHWADGAGHTLLTGRVRTMSVG
jgi:hypothetical protein